MYAVFCVFVLNCVIDLKYCTLFFIGRKVMDCFNRLVDFLDLAFENPLPPAR